MAITRFGKLVDMLDQLNCMLLTIRFNSCDFLNVLTGDRNAELGLLNPLRILLLM